MHELLADQLRRTFGNLANVPATLRPFLEAVERTYSVADAERLRLADRFKLAGPAFFENGDGEDPETSASDNERLEQHFLMVRRMEAIARFAAGVAHDFNNLLTAISGNAALALGELDQPRRMQERLEEINRAADRAGRLTHQLLAYSRQQVLKPALVDLNHLLAEVEPRLRRLLGDDVQLEVRARAPRGLVRVDPSQLEQVLIDLATNAQDAMPGGGVLTIETASVRLVGSEGRLEFAVAPGDYIRLTVSDNGIGMDEAIRDRAFEPFFTTKAPGRAAGLGLSTVYGIVKQSEGYVWLDSSPGAGCAVHIDLPRAAVEYETATVPIIHEAAPLPTPRGRATVLLADDEGAIRMLVSAILSDAGYRVLAAENGLAAFELCQTPGERVELLITDVMMPGMNGPELARRVTEVYPEARTLFISGYADRAVGGAELGEDGQAFLEKPFLPSELVARVRSLIGPA